MNVNGDSFSATLEKETLIRRTLFFLYLICQGNRLFLSKHTRDISIKCTSTTTSYNGVANKILFNLFQKNNWHNKFNNKKQISCKLYFTILYAYEKKQANIISEPMYNKKKL